MLLDGFEDGEGAVDGGGQHVLDGVDKGGCEGGCRVDDIVEGGVLDQGLLL